MKKPVYKMESSEREDDNSHQKICQAEIPHQQRRVCSTDSRLEVVRLVRMHW